MKSLNAPTTKTFLKLVAGVEPGKAKKIDNNGEGSGIMAVHVDCLQRVVDRDAEGRGKTTSLYAIAHRYEQNGDLVPDPDVEFLVTEWSTGSTTVYPLAIDQGPPFGYRRHVVLEGLKPVRANLRGQADLANFCTTWFRNMRAQQRIK